MFLAAVMFVSLFPIMNDEDIKFGAPFTASAETDINYAQLLQLSLYFFDGNMCGGDVETRSEFAWRGNCHLQDRTVSVPSEFGGGTKDLSGGFHDAGDHVKFNLPIGFAGVTLAFAVHSYKAEFERANCLDHAQRILDHYAEYYRRCIIWNADGTTPRAFAYQVGDGGGGDDHGYWGPPENQTGSARGANRRAYFTDLTSNNPGTDQVAIAAAILASNYANFGNPDDLKAAQALFAWAKSGSQGRASRGASGFYSSSKHEDKMAVAGEWLNIATNSSSYGTGGTVPHSNWAYSWDNMWPLVGVMRKDWTAVAREFGSWANNPNSYQSWSGWGNARYNAAMQGIGLAHDNLRGSGSTYSTWAHGQMRFLLGANSQNNSYVLGYPSISDSTPSVPHTKMRIHHRAATGTTTYPWNASPSNPDPKNLLTGALIGGPGSNSSGFTNDYQNYEHTEVTCDYNGSLALAAAGHLRRNPTHQPVPMSQIPGNFRTLTTPKCSVCGNSPCTCPPPPCPTCGGPTPCSNPDCVPPEPCVDCKKIECECPKLGMFREGYKESCATCGVTKLGVKTTHVTQNTTTRVFTIAVRKAAKFKEDGTFITAKCENTNTWTTTGDTPVLCAVCNSNPCTCPVTPVCTVCNNNPCTCPTVCTVCNNNPCTCGTSSGSVSMVIDNMNWGHTVTKVEFTNNSGGAWTAKFRLPDGTELQDTGWNGTFSLSGNILTVSATGPNAGVHLKPTRELTAADFVEVS